MSTATHHAPSPAATAGRDRICMTVRGRITVNLAADARLTSQYPTRADRSLT